jgi:3D (Asp-Asp-Asp) domain-containing protein
MKLSIHFLSKISQKFIEKSLTFLVILSLVWQFAFPRITSLAATDPEVTKTQIIDQLVEEVSLIKQLGAPVKVMTIPVTAYNSLPGQTDATPCITANGFNLCKNNTQNVIAANFLPFGTKVRFPDYDPETIYTVQDRMNARYYYRADIWMKTYADARLFGIKNLKVEIYK